MSNIGLSENPERNALSESNLVKTDLKVLKHDTTRSELSSTMKAEASTSKGIYTHISSGGHQSKHFYDESSLIMKTEDIRNKFDSLVTRVVEFMEANVPIGTFQAFIKRKLAFKNKNSTTKLFAQEIVEAVENSTRFCDIRSIIESYYSWINYRMIENIIQEFCHSDIDIPKALETYKEFFKMYCEERKVKGPPMPPLNGCRLQLLPPSYFKKVNFKIDGAWDYIRYENIDLCRTIITQVLDVVPDTLYLTTVEKGCVQLTFEISTHVADVLFPLTDEQNQDLEDNGIRYFGKRIIIVKVL